MKKCEKCGHKIVDKKQMVTVKTGKWPHKKTKHFCLDCFFSDKHQAADFASAVMKS